MRSQALDLAARQGADVVIDHTAVTDCSGAVRDATGSFGVSVFFDPVGGEDIRPPLRSLGWGGRYLMVGLVGGIPVVRLNQAIMKNISLIGVAYGASAIAAPRRTGKTGTSCSAGMRKARCSSCARACPVRP